MVLADTYAKERAGVAEWSFPALGTRCHLRFHTLSEAAALSFRHTVATWMRDFESTWSRFRSCSLISRINRAAGGDWVEIDETAEAMFDLAGEVAFATGGLIDPASLPITQLWQRAAQHQQRPTDTQMRAATRLGGWHRVERRPGAIRLPEAGMGIDLGGFGKEFAVDWVASLASQHGLKHILIDFGGDVVARGGSREGRPWRVGLEDPRQDGQPWAAAEGYDLAIATSGDNRRYVEIEGRRYGHIIDPRSGRPPTHGTTLVSVAARNCLQAGLLSTVAFLLGPREGLERLDSEPEVEGCIHYADTMVHTFEFHRMLHGKS